MSEAYESIPLSETTKYIVDNRGKTAPTEATGIKLIATNCVNNSNLYPTYENIRYVSQETYDNWFRAHPRPNDILLTLKGSQNGAACLVPDPVDFVIAQDMVALRANENVIDNLFLFAALRSNDVQSQIRNLDVSGVIPHLKKTDFDKLLIPFPPKSIQKSTGLIYFSLSKKIEFLQRQNKTLESMAETLFRQWFIEEAQEDWEEGKVEDLFVLQRGYDLPIQNRVDGKYPIFAASGFSGGHAECKVTAPGVTTGRSGLIGKVFFIQDDFWPLNTSLYIKEFKKGTPLFSYFFLKTMDLESFNAGSAVPTLNRNHVHESSVSIPPDKLIKEFELLMMPNFKKLRENEIQIRTLEKLRDSLLPKLMSGEVQVSYEQGAFES